MDVPAICRACLSRTGVRYHALFKESLICSERRRFIDLLLECIPTLQIAEDDNLPRTICGKCALTLKHFIRFRKRCLQSDEELKVRPELYARSESDKTTEKSDHSDESDSAEDESECNDVTAVEPKEDPVPDVRRSDDLVEIVSNSFEQYEIRSIESLKSNGKDDSVRTFQCSYCNKVLSTSKSYRYHLQLHSEVANFLCNWCGERFKTKMAYVGHMASHDPERFKCDICGKSYRQAASLRNHKLNHSQEKPFVCTVCGHSTTQKSGLKKHMLTHSESKSYVCDLCGDHFRFSSNLIMHKRRKHTVVKNYACPNCPKAFVSKDELTNHSMCHTDERPFECDKCRKTFNRKSSLQFHQKHKHSIMAKHACHVCGRGFGQKVSLQNHLKTHLLTD